MEKELNGIMEEINEIDKFEETSAIEEIQSISGLCGGHLTLICC